MEKETKITSKNSSDDFINDLWREITQRRLLSGNKSDICDFLIYLLNKHCKIVEYKKKENIKNFFDALSNEDLARILKLNISKIKTMKTNISIKFMDNDEYEDIFKDFLEQLSSGKIRLINSKDKKLRFVLENPAMRSVIENKLKSTQQDTLDYSLNSEKVEIGISEFIEMLKENYGKEKIIEAIEKAENIQFDQKIDGLKDFAKSIAITSVPKILGYLIGKI